MNRRTALKLCAIGTTPLVSGCLGIGSEDVATVKETEVSYPTLSTYASVRGRPTNDSEQNPVQLDEIDPEIKFEVVTGIHRDRYVSASPAIRKAGKTDELFAYRGSTFEIDAVYTERHGAESDPETESEWHDPVSIDVSVSGDSLTVSLVNELGNPIDIVHSGRPYFGVLVAVGESSVVLDHDQYETNESIDTEGIILTDPPDDYEEETLSSDGSVEETYTISGALPDLAEVWFGPRVRAPLDPFGDHPELVATRVTLDGE